MHVKHYNVYSMAILHVSAGARMATLPLGCFRNYYTHLSISILFASQFNSVFKHWNFRSRVENISRRVCDNSRRPATALVLVAYGAGFHRSAKHATDCYLTSVLFRATSFYHLSTSTVVSFDRAEHRRRRHKSIFFIIHYLRFCHDYELWRRVINSFISISSYRDSSVEFDRSVGASDDAFTRTSCHVIFFLTFVPTLRTPPLRFKWRIDGTSRVWSRIPLI